MPSPEALRPQISPRGSNCPRLPSANERRHRLTGTLCPSFSIVIPTYQRREVACAAVRALGGLQYSGSLELIVVVDGSSDGTAGAVARIQLPFPTRVIEQPNEGASSARNRGAAEARNEIVLFLDDDMFAEADLVEQHARMYRLGADAVIGNTPLDPESLPGFLSESIARWIDSEMVSSPLSPFDVFSGQLSVRRSVFEEVGGFDAKFTDSSAFANEDADLGVRLLERFTVRHNPAAISRQRFVVTERDFMARAPRAAAADLRFAAKNPQYARELFDRRGRSTRLGRFVYRPLSRIPLASRALSSLALWAAAIAPGTPFRSSRLLARFYSGARTMTYWSALRRLGGTPTDSSLLVLCYHAIADQSSDPILAPYGIPPDRFAEQLKCLSRRGFSFIGPDALIAFLTHSAPLPRRAVLLTFDDCYADLAEVARDVLGPLDIEAIGFAVTATLSGTNEWDQPAGANRLPLLQKEELSKLASHGVEVGSHSRTHRELPLLGNKELVDETAGSMTDLEKDGLPRPRFFAYPYGSRDAASMAAVGDAGYAAAFSVGGRLVSRHSDRLDLPRVIVLSTDRPWQFRLKTAMPRFYGRAAWVHNAALRRLKRYAGSLYGGR